MKVSGRRLLRPLAALVLALAPVGPALRAAALADAAAAETAPARVMVMLDLGADHYRAGNDYQGDYGDAAGQKRRMVLARRIARDHRLRVLENWPMTLIGVDCVIMEVPDDRSPADVARELTGIPGVSWSQPLNEFQMQGAAAPARSPARYNDRLLAAQPAAARWQLARLHQIATGRGVSIGIVDSRIDMAHPDLAGQVADGGDFVPGRPAAERHGTGVAGIIAARPNNAMGIAGIAPGAHVLALRACWERPLGGATVCDSLSLAKALTFALERRVDIVNLSLSGPPDPLLARLIAIGVARGVLFVAAVDEKRADTSFPASVPGVVAVADERLSPPRANVYIAPGLDVPTTEPEGKWSLVSGSSYAAAHVSGLLALLRQASRARRSPADLLGPGGRIDACSALMRTSGLAQKGCGTDRN